ncbi:unnamed protein product [Toxocara canis]|uniref:Secreted protein n=1 Tax=Toxocara canis TaxID=6265 RepID=A0A183UA69_TOXCA|nr:unnamed protein product [Toxocara canis]
MLLLLIQLTRLLCAILACSAGGSIENGNEIITDPTLTFQASPPVSWTYYPMIAGVTPGSPPVASFFPGQSMTATEALNRATGDVTSAVLEAFSSTGLSAPGLQVNIVYEADQISNCYTTPATPPGTRIGLLSGGAITETATVTGTAGAPVTLTSCPPRGITGVGEFQEYIKNVKVIIRGYSTTRFTWNRIASSMLSTLSFRYHVLFRSGIIVGT